MRPVTVFLLAFSFLTHFESVTHTMRMCHSARWSRRISYEWAGTEEGQLVSVITFYIRLRGERRNKRDANKQNHLDVGTGYRTIV
jgi:hypothetical protein